MVFLAVIGARTCRPIYSVTDAQRERKRQEIFIACEINNCSAEQLASLLQQLDSWPRVEEEIRK